MRNGSSGRTVTTRLRPLIVLAIATHALVALATGLIVWNSVSRKALTPVVGPDPLTTSPLDYVWTDHPSPEFPIPPYARFLQGVKIVLDPGHVGQKDKGGGWKRGPTGLREAVVNLNVARYLREFLVAAGAEVTLTREADRELGLDDAEDLRDRAEIANRLNADLLVSIHHNAAENPDANYTLVFYHRSPDQNPASLCAARHLLSGLNDALRLERHVECALRSDTTIYADAGFAVLRHARVPAVLTESSFHSNPIEEERLRDPLYNRREAYGMFLGLARWAQAGLPRVRLIGIENAGRSGRRAVVELDDGLSKRGGAPARMTRILSTSIFVLLNGERVTPKVDLARGRMDVPLPRRLAGNAELYVDFENIFGQRVLNPRLSLDVDAAESR